MDKKSFEQSKKTSHGTDLMRTGTGILLTNLGTPDAPTTKAVRQYLKEFLSDHRVVEMNRILWWLILHGVILNTRPARSAKAYQAVWSAEGSPLMVQSMRQYAALVHMFEQAGGSPVPIELAMRYGNPSITQGLDALREQGCGKILVLPLYPQYTAATTGSTFDAVVNTLKQWRWVPELRMIHGYHDHPAYIAALASSVTRHWEKYGKAERLLVSFHGIPQRYVDQGDPYPRFCRKTAGLLAEALQLEAAQWCISFQSRFGKEPWLQPYTDETLKSWGDKGLGRVDVICPGFAADCLETLEEIAVENRDYYLAAGGHSLRYIHALNADDEHIQALFAICKNHLQGWS
ncbi:MAG: ferrochelatase [Mariprofundaceae bacterium]|nr:ferrochelatase [Mariprofundaceae bacterium]